MHLKTALATALCAAAYSQSGLAQGAPATILRIDYENQVSYHLDVGDPAKFATDRGVTTAAATNLEEQLILSDIVGVNGQPAKGVYILRHQALRMDPNPTPGRPIGDITDSAHTIATWQILKPDGTEIGSLMGVGFAGTPTPPAPGAPLAALGSNVAIVGGTGAFLGARGVMGQGASTMPFRVASIAEDPANRRRFGGGKSQSVIYVIPLERPEIVAVPGTPAVFHSDLSPVTAGRPAKAGEVLITMATGLGPTRPGVDPGQPFPAYPANPLVPVNSPVEVWVNGQSAEVINAVGWPGLVNTYRVDFQVPAGTTPGAAAIQLTAAWIAGTAVNVPIQ